MDQSYYTWTCIILQLQYSSKEGSVISWDGSGNFSRTNGTNSGTETWQDDAAAGTKIRADRHDTHDQDLADGIDACITQNNESRPTADFLPDADNTYDLGSSSRQWKDIYAEEGIIINGAHTETLVTRAPITVTTISTTEASEDEISVEIPAHWNSWDAEVNFSCVIDEVSASSNTTIDFRVREGSGTGGTAFARTQATMGTAAPDTLVSASIFGFQEGRTSTGSVTWSLTSVANSNDLDYEIQHAQWQVRVFRVT